VCSSKGKIFHRQSNVGSVAENHQRAKQQLYSKESFYELPEQKITGISTLYLPPIALLLLEYVTVVGICNRQSIIF
jgi:hypothetical protein